MNIFFNVLDRQYKKYQSEYQSALHTVFDSGWYVLGKQVSAFETEFASFLGISECVGLNSGLDALTLAIRSLGIRYGDEVIVPANTYIATVLAVTQNGSTPIFVEPDEYYNIDAIKIEKAITKRTKAIIVVHLYGQAANMDPITSIAKHYHLALIEDCAQSHGASYQHKMTGIFGDIGCFSFYPTKNLGAFGDGGAIVTNHKALAEKIRLYRNYGSKIKYQNEVEGVNSRLDELQAALLRVKLNHLTELNEERKKLAANYLRYIRNTKLLLPQTRNGSDNIYHLFPIRCNNRDSFQEYLLSCGIQTQIHYPIPPHLANCYAKKGFSKFKLPITEAYASKLLSIPLYNGMTDEEQGYVIDCINRF